MKLPVVRYSPVGAVLETYIRSKPSEGVELGVCGLLGGGVLGIPGCGRPTRR